LNKTSHSLAFFDGTPLFHYEASLRKDHLQCFTGAIILYSPSDAQSLDAAKGIVDELRGYEMACMMKGGIVLVCNEIRAGKEGRELEMIEGADAHFECDIETGEGCEEAVGKLVEVIEERWEEREFEREKRSAREEWEAKMRKRRMGRRRVLCGGSEK
jgi:hypothetical protein